MINPQPTLTNLNVDPAAVQGYEFEPIKGYPMLNWRGKRPFTSTHYYPAQHKETHGQPVDGWLNKIFWGDNLQVMSHLLKEFRGKVQLIYIDPPFDSKADYKKQVSLRGKQASNDHTTFEEKQYTDIWTNDDYLQFIYERLILIRELLADEGSIYLHCDWHKGHHLKCIMDEIFGTHNFANEIIWKRSANTSSIGKIWKRSHDTLLFYSKSNVYKFNFQRKPLSDASMDIYSLEDEKGKYRLVPLLVSGKRNGRTGQIWKGIDPNNKGATGMHWVTTPDKLDEYEKRNLIVWPKKEGGSPNLKYYLDDNLGVVISDIWDDLNLISSNSLESLGYPTQKPEAILERIINASSNPGDIVFDSFMGSGTTQAVAMKLGRRFIGADINLGAIQITTKRLLQVANDLQAAPASPQTRMALADPVELDDEEAESEAAPPPTTFYTGFEVYNVNHYDVFRNPVQARDLLLEALEIQPLPSGHVFDGELDGRMVKLMPINRIATKADLNDLISGVDYRAFEKRQAESPNKAVERITLVCMGHEADLQATLEKELKPYKVDITVVDILRDRQDLQFKRDSEAKLVIEQGQLVIAAFYPMNLLGKLSLQQADVTDWRELAESVMLDWNYDGGVFEPKTVDIPAKDDLVTGRYAIPRTAGTIRVKITDLLSESWEGEVQFG